MRLKTILYIIRRLIVILSLTYVVGGRLFGAAFIYAGYDSTHGFQLYNSDPSGNYAGWKA